MFVQFVKHNYLKLELMIYFCISKLCFEKSVRTSAIFPNIFIDIRPNGFGVQSVTEILKVATEIAILNVVKWTQPNVNGYSVIEIRFEIVVGFV